VLLVSRSAPDPPLQDFDLIVGERFDARILRGIRIAGSFAGRPLDQERLLGMSRDDRRLVAIRLGSAIERIESQSRGGLRRIGAVTLKSSAG